MSWIAALPEDPVQFKSQHPMIYNTVFTSNPPVKSKITALMMEQLRQSSKMRASRRGSVILPDGLGQAGIPPQVAPQVMAFGQALMQHMVVMQQRMSELSQGNGDFNGHSPQPKLGRSSSMLALSAPPPPTPASSSAPVS